MNGKLEQETSTTSLLYPLKSDHFICVTGLGTSRAQFEGEYNDVLLTILKRTSLLN